MVLLQKAASTQASLNTAVYAVYGLNAEEIALIEREVEPP
jgi:hypothetical protein